MTVHLVTGHSGEVHVTAAEQGQYNAYVFGSGNYIINGCELTVVDDYTVHVAAGTYLIQGRHVNVNDGGENIAIKMGKVGQRRRDAICLKYEMDVVTGIERCSFAVVEGTLGNSYITPTVEAGSILAGDNPCLVPLYTIDVNAELHLENPTKTCDSFVTYAEAFDGISQLRKEAEVVITDTQNKLNAVYDTANLSEAEIRAKYQEIAQTLNIDGYATKQYVDGKIGSIDFSALATKTYVSEYVDGIAEGEY